MPSKTLITFPAALLATALSFAPIMLRAEDEHEHEPVYIDEGEVDVVLQFHEDEGELEFALLADEHDHEDEGEADHDDGEAEHEHEDEADSEEDEHGHDHEHGEGIDFEEAILLAGAETAFVLPESGDYAFLGEAGNTVYILPQDATGGPPAPGFDIAIEAGLLVDDAVAIRLTALEGPGDLIAYQVDGFGAVTIVFDTRDGLDDSDSYTGEAETHAHLNWAFTAAGIYRLTLQAEGTLVANDQNLSAEAVLTVQAGSGAAYLRHIDAYADGWASTENMGPVYDAQFPWLYALVLGGWTFASGEGGEEMLLFPQSLQTWLYSGAEIAPWYYNFGSNSWIYLVETPVGTFYYDQASEAWLALP